jgi:hypothetical protein
MDRRDKETIHRFARGSNTDRVFAEAIHMRELRTNPGAYEMTQEYRFLSEVFSPCPDLTLRALARKKLLEIPTPPKGETK